MIAIAIHLLFCGFVGASEADFKLYKALLALQPRYSSEEEQYRAETLEIEANMKIQLERERRPPEKFNEQGYVKFYPSKAVTIRREWKRFLEEHPEIQERLRQQELQQAKRDGYRHY